MRILKEHGIDPAPIRGRSMSWATFIKAHLGAIAAADFFTVEVTSWAGLIRYHVLFLIDIASRKVEIAGLTRSPDGTRMDQVARNLLDAEDGVLLRKKYPPARPGSTLHDGVPNGARTRWGGGGALPARSPNLNAFAERFVLSIKAECLDRIVPLGERHLRRAVSEFVAHYHCERNHQGIENRLIDGPRSRGQQRKGSSAGASRRPPELLPSGSRMILGADVISVQDGVPSPPNVPVELARNLRSRVLT
jgi:hypothetical protein